MHERAAAECKEVRAVHETLAAEVTHMQGLLLKSASLQEQERPQVVVATLKLLKAVSDFCRVMNQLDAREQQRLMTQCKLSEWSDVLTSGRECLTLLFTTRPVVRKPNQLVAVTKMDFADECLKHLVRSWPEMPSQQQQIVKNQLFLTVQESVVPLEAGQDAGTTKYCILHAIIQERYGVLPSLGRLATGRTVDAF